MCAGLDGARVSEQVRFNVALVKALEHDGRVIAASPGCLRRCYVQNAGVVLLMLMHVNAQSANFLLDRRQHCHDGRQSYMKQASTDNLTLHLSFSFNRHTGSLFVPLFSVTSECFRWSSERSGFRPSAVECDRCLRAV